MLRIYYDNLEEAVYNCSAYFKWNYRPEWLACEDVRQRILDVDHSIVLGNGAIDSPVLGVIAPTALSGGVKTLILIDKVPKRIFNASNCGDNCAAWLIRLEKKKDITINLRHIMDFGDEPFEAEILNTNQIVTSMRELVPIAGRLV